jgi:flagellar biosynthesis protein FlhG
MRTLAVTSGKGGVGKTNLSANLGIALAARGQRVLVFDADIGLANLDVVLGCRANATLQHVVSGEKSLEEVIQPGPGGIRFVAGGSGVEALVNLEGPTSARFLDDLAKLESKTDFLIFDTGAGIDGNVMTFLTAADEVLIIVTPDPASLTDGYATAKALWMRRPDAAVRVILNMVDDESQARAVYAKLYSIAMQFLGKSLKYGGHVRLDSRAVACIRQRRPFVLAEPGLMATQDVKSIAANLLGERIEARQEGLVDRLKGVFSLGLRRSA